MRFEAPRRSSTRRTRSPDEADFMRAMDTDVIFCDGLGVVSVHTMTAMHQPRRNLSTLMSNKYVEDSCVCKPPRVKRSRTMLEGRRAVPGTQQFLGSTLLDIYSTTRHKSESGPTEDIERVQTRCSLMLISQRTVVTRENYTRRGGGPLRNHTHHSALYEDV